MIIFPVYISHYSIAIYLAHYDLTSDVLPLARRPRIQGGWLCRFGAFVSAHYPPTQQSKLAWSYLIDLVLNVPNRRDPKYVTDFFQSPLFRFAYKKRK